MHPIEQKFVGKAKGGGFDVYTAQDVGVGHVQEQDLSDFCCAIQTIEFFTYFLYTSVSECRLSAGRSSFEFA